MEEYVLRVRIIIGGPPNSGKSTLAEILAMALRSFRVDAYAEDLDLAAMTLDYIRGIKPWEQRPHEKKEWTPELAKQAVERFREASKKHHVVIGDAPGKITDESRIIAQQASHGIILCRDDCTDEIEEWKAFFKSLRIRIIVVAISKMSGTGCVSVNGVIEAIIIGLDRKPRINEIVMSLAWHVKERLNV